MDVRLGCDRGFEDVKDHPFFDGVNWDELYNKQLVNYLKPRADAEPPALQAQDENEAGAL